ncbi:MAG: hypothetical protein OEQ13_06410 [Acidobacteriota bacterium]|nr:hypothetical protein [Acidobacteriota bacterium]
MYAEMEEGYPKSLCGNAEDAGAPVTGAFDRDGLGDVAVAITDVSYGGIVAAYDMPGVDHDERHVWTVLSQR